MLNPLDVSPLNAKDWPIAQKVEGAIDSILREGNGGAVVVVPATAEMVVSYLVCNYTANVWIASARPTHKGEKGDRYCFEDHAPSNCAARRGSLL